jgi:hypothetical protein
MEQARQFRNSGKGIKPELILLVTPFHGHHPRAIGGTGSVEDLTRAEDGWLGSKLRT